MEKSGFHSWTWLIILLLGGLLMIFGGTQDIMIFLMPEIILVESWYPVLPIVGLVGGLVVLASGVLNSIWGWQLKRAEYTKEKNLACRVAIVSAIGMVTDWIAGYYGFGSLVALLTSIWLIQK